MERKLRADLVAWNEKKVRKPLVIRGVRQVGKTYLMKDFGNQCFAKFHYFNFEENSALNRLFERDLKPERILSELQFQSKRVIDPMTDLLIFDEIQECPRALTSLKYFQTQVATYLPFINHCFRPSFSSCSSQRE